MKVRTTTVSNVGFAILTALALALTWALDGFRSEAMAIVVVIFLHLVQIYLLLGIFVGLGYGISRALSAIFTGELPPPRPSIFSFAFYKPYIGWPWFLHDAYRHWKGRA